MKAVRNSLTLALSVVLLGCNAQTPQTTPAQQRAGDSSPAGSSPQEQTHEASTPPHTAAAAEDGHAGTPSMLRLDQGQPWATDAPLVEGMERIRVAVNEAAARPALDTDSAAALARSVRDQVDFLIANCKLEPDADATLHVFIARLLNAAAAVQKDPASSKGLPELQQVLREYPHYFAHPGWQPESLDKE